MSSYQLFDQSISFPDSAERFFDMQYHAWNAISAASNDFDAWYEKCGNILTVLKGYKEKACELIIQYANRPLFNELASYEIYDLSEDSYDKKCLAFSKSLEALAVIREKYEDILAEQAAEEEYRAERKENLGRVFGGGFGVGGALKGMAAAGAMNAISGVGHDIVNVIGNASSALVAASSKSALYNSADTRTMMREGIKADILNCFNAHMELLNNRITSHIVSVFDADKAEALFENAKKVADKQKHLLIESFKNCPWNEELFEFVFIHYKTERKNIWNISKRFHIDLSKTAEETFAASYTEKARTSEEESQIVKKDILAQMRELGISSSATIKAIELDGLNRILRDYDSVADENRGPIFEAFDNYDADRSNKSEAVYKNGVWELAQKYDVKFSSEEADAILAKYYIESAQNVEAEALKARVKMTAIMEILGISQSFTLDKLENDCLERICNNYQNADEQMCNRIIKYIREFEALQKNKEPFLQKVQAQI
ncbi:MAG: hypothetical protein IJY28_05170 [Clostridia bacterium]|nr:hypothetical protein [Clostridia bacterium]